MHDDSLSRSDRVILHLVLASRSRDIIPRYRVWMNTISERNHNPNYRCRSLFVVRAIDRHAKKLAKKTTKVIAR